MLTCPPPSRCREPRTRSKLSSASGRMRSGSWAGSCLPFEAITATMSNFLERSRSRPSRIAGPGPPRSGRSITVAPSARAAAAVPPASYSCASAIPPAHQLALVQLRGVSGYVVRDITDILHPVTRCTFHGGSYFRFVSETRLSYIVTASGDQGAAAAMYVADLNSGTTSWVRAWASSGSLSSVYGWSPDGRALSYISSVVNNNVEWHLLSA